jgi:hypothetical protein
VSTYAGRLRARRPPAARPGRLTSLRARLHASSLDRELASGIAPWRSPLHAARALQLTSVRRRRAYAEGLERLLAEADRPRRRTPYSAVVLADRALLLNAPVVWEIVAALRAPEPVSAEAMARLHALLSDGSGPIYTPGDPDRLHNMLAHVARWIRVPT